MPQPIRHIVCVIAVSVASAPLAGEKGKGDVACRVIWGDQRVIDAPIRFGPRRKALTLEYLRRHADPGAKDILILPRVIVLHWTACGSIHEALRWFDREELPAARADIRGGGLVNVSAHYLVDRDGTVFRLMPDTWMARHVIGLNHCAIGIENVGGPAWPLTEAQVEANARLASRLMRLYPTIAHIIGHHEYLQFKGTPLWRQRDPSYRAYKKIDPGDAFVNAVRALIARCAD